MKDLTFLAILVWLMGAAGFAFAQSTIPTVTMNPTVSMNPVATNTPNIAMPINTAVPTTPDLTGTSTTSTQIKARVSAQGARINSYSRVGQLTADEASVLQANLKAIRDKIKADFAENGKKQLTDDQKVELNKMLDDSEKKIGDRNGIQSFN